MNAYKRLQMVYQLMMLPLLLVALGSVLLLLGISIIFIIAGGSIRDGWSGNTTDIGDISLFLIYLAALPLFIIWSWRGACRDAGGKLSQMKSRFLWVASTAAHFVNYLIWDKGLRPASYDLRNDFRYYAVDCYIIILAFVALVLLIISLKEKSAEQGAAPDR